jgi:hypothetical protein
MAMHLRIRAAVALSGLAALSPLALVAPQPLLAEDAPATAQEGTCAALAARVPQGAPVAGLVVTAARWQAGGTPVATREGTIAAPPHCLVEGYFGERPGLVGGPYRIAFRMRLPAAWNGRFLYTGGGGSNGVVGDALGFNGIGNTPGLMRGYAVIAQDSGHDNSRNMLPDHGGDLVFGHDPQARRDYGFASLKPSYDVGRHVIRAFYGRDSSTNLFWGCSKGGQEGMAFAQRFPDAFDGILAMAPGFALPRAALAEAWGTQALAGVLRDRGQVPTVAGLKTVFTQAQSTLISQAVLAACDGLDGARDGMVGAVGQCTTARVLPELRRRQCAPGATGACLEPGQIAALERLMAGPRNRAGKALYASWPWDAGVGLPGWRLWTMGLDKGPPALNVVLGAGSLAAVFTTPPAALGPDPEKLLAWQLAFDFDRDAPRIYAVAPPFTESAWFDVGMHATDLSAFRAHGGKLIVPHGMSDPVFSANDTIAWWNAVDRGDRGHAADFVRVFPIPGMNHCGGGPATDRFDGLGALEHWVLDHQAPQAIPASAGPDTPWPGRERPLCPYPSRAVPAGSGFACRPQSGRKPAA